MITLSVLDEVTQALAQDQNLIRIRKLLVYACENVWEIDPHQLKQYPLTDLIQTLLQIAPTLEQLKSYLHKLVETLNKPAEYTLVANAVVSYLKRLYPDAPVPSSAQRQQYQTIAHSLAQDPDPLRIKKLLLCACTQHWETDAQRLAQRDWVELVQDLHELASTPKRLELMLDSVLSSLNRQAYYRPIAQRILVTMQRLYASSMEETLTLSPEISLSSSSEQPIVDTEEEGSTGLRLGSDAFPEQCR